MNIKNVIATFFAILILLFVIGCTQTQQGGIGSSQLSNPHKELLRNDYYAYIFTNEVLDERQWKLVPIEHNWDAHCMGGPSAPWNPLLIVYQDQEEDTQLLLNISNRNVIWDRQRSVEEIKLDFLWVEEGMGVKYKGEDNSSIKFTDIFGNEVVVSGSQSTDEKIRLINQLEYIGPSDIERINPWSAEWCNHH